MALLLDCTFVRHCDSLNFTTHNMLPFNLMRVIAVIYPLLQRSHNFFVLTFSTFFFNFSCFLKLCGDAAKKALAKQMAEERRLKAKYTKPALTVEAKRLRKKMKKVDQLKEDIKRMERIQKEKILQKNKLLKDIDA